LYANHELNKQRIELSDGSVVYLDAGSKLTVAMSAQERRLDLETGRAFFEVAHDKSRPFSVSKAGTRVVALGTRFQVEVVPSNQSVNVTLVEGSVAVTNSGEADTWREVLNPGQQLLVDNLLHRHQIVRVNTDAITSWSTGFLVFDGMPLRKVLDEMNRYTKVKVLLGDSSLADMPVAGSFIAGGDTNEFVETLTTALPLKSALTGANEIALFHKYGTNNN
jgi:transmembrane sensor